MENITELESWEDVITQYWEKRKQFGIPVDYEMTQEEEDSFYISEEAIREWVDKRQFI